MRVQTIILSLTSLTAGLIVPRQEKPSYEAPASTNVVDSQYDGTCFYPVPDTKFDLEAYLGTWYQVAGTPFGPTAGARCVTANYKLNVSFLLEQIVIPC